MAFYDGLGKRIQQTGQGAIDKTRKTAEVSRINSSISSLEKEMRNDYEDLGRAYYEKYAATGTDDPDMVSYFQELDSKMEQLEVYKEQIRNLKGIRKCVNCGMEISADAVFCNYCGTRQPAVASPSQNVQRVCPNCGTPLEEGQFFCTVCGTNVENVTANPVAAEAEPPAEAGPEPEPEGEPVFEPEAVVSVRAVCPKCGAELEEDAIFCTNCGQKIEI